MTFSHWIRQTHRWDAPLLPLFVLLFSGLYLFVLPYAAKRRTARVA